MADGQPGAPLGNSNAAKGKQWLEQVNKALIQYEDSDVPQGKALFYIAKRMVRDALNGDKDARREIAERLDGKSMQSLTISGDEDKPLISMIRMVVVQAVQGQMPGQVIEQAGESVPALADVPRVTELAPALDVGQVKVSDLT